METGLRAAGHGRIALHRSLQGLARRVGSITPHRAATAPDGSARGMLDDLVRPVGPTACSKAGLVRCSEGASPPAAATSESSIDVVDRPRQDRAEALLGRTGNRLDARLA